MGNPDEIAEAIAEAGTWNARVGIIRRIPELFGTGQHASVYATVAKRVYVPKIESEFAYVHWRKDYELAPIEAAYELAREGTRGFNEVSRSDLADVIGKHPETLRIFRLLLGFTTGEFAEACALEAAMSGRKKIGIGTLKSVESGKRVTPEIASGCAAVVDAVIGGDLFPPKDAGPALRRKLDKPDTAQGWESVRRYAGQGVPLPVLLHQRAYGGAFRQLLDATSTNRGDLLEDPVEELFLSHGIPFLRTGAHNQASIEQRFGLNIRPAPDFVVFDDEGDVLRAILECKGASDGGTARDKAARFRSLRGESQRLGGVPVFAVLGGVGWRRVPDALGPVIRDTDGRTFTMATLAEMIETEPFPSLSNTRKRTEET